MPPFSVLLFAAFFVLAAPPAVHVVVGQQKGFVSIDCGHGANYSGYTDRATGIMYVPDEPYTDAGENHRIADDIAAANALPEYVQTLRSFPSSTSGLLRNCYALPTTAGTRYLLRATFVYGNYDGKNSSSSSLHFDLHLGSNFWDTLYAKPLQLREAIFVAWAGTAPLCLVDTGNGTPFVNVVELRPLGTALYPLVTPGLIVSTQKRMNFGAADSVIRYPNDPYDRWWSRMDSKLVSQGWVNMSAPGPIQPDASYGVPSVVLQTAVAASGNGTALTAMTWQADGDQRPYSIMVLMHFADFQQSQLRQFDILVNPNDAAGPRKMAYSPLFMASHTIYVESYRAADGSYNFTLAKTNASSVLPPMINALEIYVRVPYSTPTTLPQDFDAIMAIKTEYGVKKNWMGDPCFPIKYAWDGVKCSDPSGNISRIISLNLSNSSLRGTISKNFTLLTALQNLDLSYNSLSGSIPDSLPTLPSLRVLNVSANQLSDDSLCKSYTGSLIFRHDSNKSTCNKKTSASRKRTLILVHSVVGGVLVVSAIVLAYFICRAKRKSTVSVDDHTRNAQLEIAPRSRTDQGDHLQDNENRRFTHKDLEKFTDNFKQFIGQGGFGVVYFGHLEDGTEVAVKMRSESSSHGLDEFLAEVQSLTKVHHRNIVSLVGYCWEKDHLALVYEYMSQGNLYDHLRGKMAASETLMSWATRVRIVLEAAQGLDYLHKGCSPPIIHRDVKSSNILLSHNLQAKIADMGLSKTYMSDGHTHISATAAGTAGYMDPEYYFTGRLTESSDVYSFGVVLLEAATGEPPLVPGQGHIVQRVKQRVSATGDIGSVADPRLGAAYDINSMWKVVDTAMACTTESGAGRPTMGEVVAQLKDSLALEYARDNDDRSVPASVAASDSAALMMSGFGPSAR